MVTNLKKLSNLTRRWWGCVENGRHCSEGEKKIDVRVFDSGNWQGYTLKLIFSSTVFQKPLIYLAACKDRIHYFEEKMAIIDESVFNSGKRQSYKLKFTVFIYYKNYLIYLIMLRDIGNYHCDNIIISCFPPKTGNYCWECIQFWEMVVLQTYYS